MKPNPIATRALAGMLPAMALFATPATAQDAAPPATVPPPTVVVPTPPAAAATEPAATGPSAEDRAKFEASASAATGSAASAATDPAPATQARRAPARPTARKAAPARPSAAPLAAAPAATPPAPVATAPVEPTAAAPLPDAPMTTPVPEEPIAAGPATTETNATETTTAAGGVPVWGWVLGAIAILGAIAAFVGLRRRRNATVWEEEDAVYVEPAYEAPVAAVPLAAAPATAAAIDDVAITENAEVVAPAADEVAAITAASAPITGRPWIELSLRPVRAGTNEESATVDLELTLANAGELAARDVRVSTFMLGDASDVSSDVERLLTQGHGGTEVDAGDIAAGEGSRVDATLVTPLDNMQGSTFQPIVVADVRYTLPDGGEGRTAAAFSVGVDDGTEAPTPLRLGGDMREDISATLHGVLERA